MGEGLSFLILLVMFNCVFVTLPCDTLGQMWDLIVLIPDLCRLSYFENQYLVFLRVTILHMFYCMISIKISYVGSSYAYVSPVKIYSPKTTDTSTAV